MKNDIETVTISKVEYDELTAKISANESYITELTAKVEWLMEQFRLAQHRRFGASSEKSTYDQVSLFNEAEVASDILVPEPELVEIEKHFRKRKNTVNDKLPANMPVETVVHELPEEEQICPECGGKLHVMVRKPSAAS